MTDGSGALGRASGTITLDVGPAQRSIDKLIGSFGSLDRVGAGLGAGMGAAMDKVALEAESAADRINAAAKRIQGLGLGLTAGVTAPIVALGFTVVGMASDVNEAMSAVKTVYGDAADTIIARSEDAAAAVGLSQEEYLSATTNLAAYGEMQGLNAEQTADWADQQVRAAADLASFYNTDIASAQEAINAGLRGEGDALEKYGIVMNQATVEAYALENGLWDGNEAMTNQQLIAARSAYIYDHLGAAQGDFARTSDGLANKQRILSAQLKDVGASFGQILLPVMMKGVGIIQQVVGAIAGMSRPAQTVVVVIAAIAAAIGPLLIVLGTLLGAVGSVVGAFSAGGALAGLTALLGPIAAIIAVIALLAVAYKTNFLGFGDAVRSVASTVRDAFTGIVDGISDFIGRFTGAFESLRSGTVLRPIHDLAGGLTTAMVAVAEPMQLVESLIHALATAIRGIGGDSTPQFLVSLAGWLDKIAPQVQAFVDLIQDVGSYISEAFNTRNAEAGLDRFTGPLRTVMHGIGKLVDTLADLKAAFGKGGVMGVIRAIPGELRDVRDAFSLIFRGIGKAITDFTDDIPVVGTVVRTLGDIFTRIGETVDDVVGQFTVFRNAGMSPVSSAVAALSNVFTGFRNTFQLAGEQVKNLIGIFQGLRDAFTALMDGDLAGVFDGLRDAFTSLLDAIGTGAKLIGTLLLDAFNAIDWTAVGSLVLTGLQLALDGLSAIGGWILDAVSGIDFTSIGTTVLDGITGAIGSGLDVLSDFVADIVTGAMTAWDNNKETFLSILRNLASDLLGVITSGATVLGAFVLDIVNGAVDAWNAHKETFLAILRNLATDLLGVVVGGAEVLAGLVARIVDGAVTAWNANKERFLAILRNLAADLLGVVVGGASVLAGFVADVVTGAVAAWNANKDTFLAILRNLGSDLLGVLGSGLTVLAGFVGDIVAGAVAAWDTHKESFLAILRALPGDLLGIIGDGAGVLAAFVGTIVDGAVQHWAEVVQPFKDIFLNLGANLVNLLNLEAIPVPDFGFITEPIQLLSDTITSVADWIVDTAWPKVSGWATGIAGSLGTPDFSAFRDPIQAVSDTVSAVADFLVDTAWPKLTGWAGDIGGSLGAPDFSALVEPIQTISDVITEVADWIVDTAWPKLSGWAATIASSLMAPDFSVITGPFQTFSDTVTGVVDWVTGKFNTFVDFLSTLKIPQISLPDLSWLPFVDDKPEAKPSDPAMGGSPAPVDAVSAGAIALAVEAAAARIRTAFQQIIGDGIFMKESLVSQFVDAGTTIGGHVEAFNADVPVRFGTGMSAIINHAIAMKLGIIQQFIDAGVTIGGHLTDFLNDVPVRFGEGMTDILNHAIDMKIGAVQQFTDLDATARSLVSTMKIGTTSDIRDLVDTAISQFGRLISDGVGKLRRGAGDLRDAGRYAGEMATLGVADGMDSYLYRVTNAVNNIVSEVDRALRAGLRVASPSKLTSWYGEMTTEGYAKGITAQLSSVAGAVGKVVGTVTAGLRDSLDFSAAFGFGIANRDAAAKMNAAQLDQLRLASAIQDTYENAAEGSETALWAMKRLQGIVSDFRSQGFDAALAEDGSLIVNAASYWGKAVNNASNQIQRVTESSASAVAAATAMVNAFRAKYDAQAAAGGPLGSKGAFGFGIANDAAAAKLNDFGRSLLAQARTLQNQYEASNFGNGAFLTQLTKIVDTFKGAGFGAVLAEDGSVILDAAKYFSGAMSSLSAIPPVQPVGMRSQTINNSPIYNIYNTIDARNVEDFLHAVSFVDSLENGTAASIVFGSGRGY